MFHLGKHGKILPWCEYPGSILLYSLGFLPLIEYSNLCQQARLVVLQQHNTLPRGGELNLRLWQRLLLLGGQGALERQLVQPLKGWSASHTLLLPHPPSLDNSGVTFMGSQRKPHPAFP